MSSAKELIFEEEAREKLRQGIHLLSEVVGVTLGPKGRNVGLDAKWGAPTITNHGSEIIKDVEFKDQYLNMGVSLGKEVGSKMKEKCGDGTTTSILLLDALVQNGVKNIASGFSPIHLKRGMEKAMDAIVAELEKNSLEVKTDKETQNIATVSAGGDTEIGSLIANALKRVGKEGVITIEEGKGTETTIDLVEGMQFDRGYTSAYFCTNPENLTVEMHNPRILITDKKLSSIQEILPLLQATASRAQDLLIIAEDIEGDALSTLVINKLRGTLKVCAVKAPGFGDRRKALLEDLAILTGGELISEERGQVLKEATESDLGIAEKVIVTKENTTLIKGEGDSKEIQARVLQIEKEIEAATSDWDKEKLQERKAKLSGGVAVIRVGAPTEAEMKQKKQIFQDSLNSTRAAHEKGVVAGGGVALLRARKAAESLQLSKEEAIGAQIVIQACVAPFKRIVDNCGVDSSVILEETKKKEANFGFNTLTEKVEDLVKEGVVDPAKLVIHALRFAISTAGIVLLSEVLIGNAPEEEDEPKA